MKTNQASPGKAPIPDEVRQALGFIGSIKTPRKSAASAENGKRGGRPVKALSDIECNCGAGDSLQGHSARCLRGKAIARRQKAGTL